MDSDATLVFRFGNMFLEDSFDLSQTVGSVKEDISDHILGASSTQLRFELSGKGILVDDQRLAEIFPQGGFHIVEVTVLPPQSIVVPTFESSTLRSVSPEPRTKSGCLPIPAPVTPEPVPSTCTSDSRSFGNCHYENSFSAEQSNHRRASQDSVS